MSEDYIYIVFDGPPGPEAGRFVEVETGDGASVKRGRWLDRGDGYWTLELRDPDSQEAELAALKARRCETCDRQSICYVFDTWGQVHPDFACNRWTARAEEGGG